MEITSRFNRDDFEIWVDHFQYLDIGERHQSVPSGKSYIRGTFDPEQNAYIIDKIHIDPDMLRTDVKAELLHEAKLQARKRDKRLLQKKRVAAMPKHEPRMRMEKDQPSERGPMVTRDLQTAVWRVADSLARSLKDPQGATPGDARWTVSGLSHSSWSINHPDILTDGESPLTLRIKKLPDGRWVAFGQNRLTNLMNTKILAIKKTPPGGDDWDDIETFASTTATYFQEQKGNILALKQAMTPQNAPGAGYGGQPQQQGGPGGEMGGMGGGMGGMGGMMASRRARRRKAANVLTPQQAMIALQIKGTGDIEKDKANLRQVVLKYHPDRNKNESAKRMMKAYETLKDAFIDQNKPLPTTAQAAGQGAGIGGQETAIQVHPKVQEYVSLAVNQASRLQQSISKPGVQISPNAAIMNINNLSKFVNGAMVTIQANPGAQDSRARSLYEKLKESSYFLARASAAFNQTLNQRVLADAIMSLGKFIQIGTEVRNSMTTKQSSRRASATLDNLRKAQRIARQIHRSYTDEDWYLGVRVVNDRRGIGLGIGAAFELPGRLRGSLEGIPLVLEGPGARLANARQESQRRLRLAMRIAAEVVEEMDETERVAIRETITTPLNHLEETLLQEIENYPAGVSIQNIEDKRLLRSLIQKGYLEVYPGNKVRSLGVAASRVAAEELGIDPEEAKVLKQHQKLVKKVYNQIKNNKRLFGSVRYMSRKMGIDFNDLVKVIGQLIVEGKIEMTKKKKFRPLEPPHTPIPGMDGKFASTNSVFGIDRGRSDKRVDQLLTQSNFQLNLDEPEPLDGTKYMRDIREKPSKIMPDPTSPN